MEKLDGDNHVLLSSLDETIIQHGKEFHLAVKKYPGGIYHPGHKYLRDFTSEPIPTLTYSVEGTPVDCVNFSLGGLNLRPDLVVSGINDGYNLGFDTKYSGTLGACFQAQYFGFKTVAFSSDNRGIKMVESEFEKSFKYILENELLSNKYTLNVNFPRESFGESKGILHTNLFYQEYEYEPEIVDNKYIPNRRIVRTENLPKDSDAYAFRKGYTSISKLNI